MSEKENKIDLKPGTNQDDLLDFNRDLADDLTEQDLLEGMGEGERDVLIAEQIAEESRKTGSKLKSIDEISLDDLKEMYGSEDLSDEEKMEVGRTIGRIMARTQDLKIIKEKPPEEK